MRGQQQSQTSYIRPSAEVMTTILYTVKETSSPLFDLSTAVFRHHQKHSCTLPSVEKTQNKYAKEWQTTDNSAIWTVMQFRNKSLCNLTNLSSAHAHRLKKKANYSVCISQEHSLWVTCNLVNIRGRSVNTLSCWSERSSRRERPANITATLTAAESLKPRRHRIPNNNG